MDGVAAPQADGASKPQTDDPSASTLDRAPAPPPEMRLSIGPFAMVLRLNGRVVATAEGDGGGMDVVRARLKAALKEAEFDEFITRLAESGANWTSRLTLELETSGASDPILGKTFEQVIDRIDPGATVVSMRRGERMAHSFPAIMQTTNSLGDPASALAKLCRSLDLPPRDLPELQAIDSVAIYSAPSIRLVQTAPDAPPFEVVRGHRLVIGNQASEAALDRFGREIAAWLLRQLPSVNPTEGVEPLERLGIPGTFRPTTDSHESPSAPPGEQALVALALARHAAGLPQDDQLAQAEVVGAWRLLAALGEVDQIERDPLSDTIACALAVMARQSLDSQGGRAASVPAPSMSAARSFCDRAAARLAAAPQTLTVAERAAVLAAQPGLPARRTLLNSLWLDSDADDLVSALPFLMEAERQEGKASAETLARAHSVRELLARVQMGPRGGATSAADLSGAFALSMGARRHAGSQSARPGTGLAIMLALPEFTSGKERLRSIGMQGALLRFLRQLQCDDSTSWLMRNPNRAAGGLKVSLCDMNMPVAASAMALWCVTESGPAIAAQTVQLESALGADSRKPIAAP